ncbi:hypothetical protein FQA47_015284 [Oryzias melastigma]|uniref:Uncharacterized protein n=1 Tax=Oryzias melastigma TaxID=30732 RepID=A0A834FCT9_ORYME|nr:hypothetical protein FQA47_015284 [Oryzias melastigma]
MIKLRPQKRSLWDVLMEERYLKRRGGAERREDAAGARSPESAGFPVAERLKGQNTHTHIYPLPAGLESSPIPAS